MDRKSWGRWALDLAVIVMLAYAAWSFRQFATLQKSDIRQEMKIEAIDETIHTLDQTLIGLTKAITRQGESLDAVLLLQTFRTDPWSGRMMHQYHLDWMDWVRREDPDFRTEDAPDVFAIQRELSGDLIPNGVQDILNKKWEPDD